MTKVSLDWSSLGFGYMPISKRYVATYKDGKWGPGALTDDPTVPLNECAGILQYCQQVFEGLKAYKTKDGRTVTFRHPWSCRPSERKTHGRFSKTY